MEKSQDYKQKIPLKGMKIALVHDFLVTRGGAERVLGVLTEMFPEAPIYTLLYDQEKMGDSLADKDIRPSFLQKLPSWLRKRHRWLLPLYPVAVETFDLREFDLVISSSGAWSKGVITRLNTQHVAYVHSPMRYAWDYHEEYLRELGGGKFSLCKRLLLSYLRVWDGQAADRPDWILSNSRYTQARVEKYYRRESEVLYPPVICDEKFAMGDDKQEVPKVGGYFLTVSRLTANKKVDVIIDAFNKLGLPLIVAGEGREEKRLRHMAGENIAILGWQSEEALQKLYTQARGFIFAAEEDFGMSMAEALQYGVPVIAYAKGGAREIVKEGVTGEFFAAQAPEVLADGVRRFLEKETGYDKDQLQESAQQFSRENFEKTFLKFLEEKYGSRA